MSTRLFLNAGNSNLNWAVWDEATAAWPAEGRETMWQPEEALSRLAEALADVDQAAEAIAVTSRPDLPAWEQTATELLGRSLLVLGRDFSAEIRTEYRNPEQLGQDRVANIVAARGEGLPPCLILDAGTCLTADVLDRDGVHEGGAIADGWPALWAGVMAVAPHLRVTVAEWPKAPLLGWGRSTAENLALGWGVGLLGIARELVARYHGMTEPGGAVILTGGDAEGLAESLGEAVLVRSRLTLDGLRVAWESRSRVQGNHG